MYKGVLSTSRIMWKSSRRVAISNLQQCANKLHTISHWYISGILKQWNSFVFRTLQFHQQGIHRVVLYKTQLIICATCRRTQKWTASNPCRIAKYTKQNGRLLHYFNTLRTGSFKLFKSFKRPFPGIFFNNFNPLNAELNPICYLLALLELTIFSTLAG